MCVEDPFLQIRSHLALILTYHDLLGFKYKMQTPLWIENKAKRYVFNTYIYTVVVYLWILLTGNMHNIIGCGY